MTSQISCIAHMKFTCELRRIENPNEQQLGRKPARLITSPGRRILLFLGNFTRCFLKDFDKKTKILTTYHRFLIRISSLMSRIGNGFSFSDQPPADSSML
uniref:SFRICE_017136 n=1 Tax=Spodoptera frugiperda TaxID=7108 RepID=A0A2H1V4X5_SPOFR